jgi:hypothetical protein
VREIAGTRGWLAPEIAQARRCSSGVSAGAQGAVAEHLHLHAGTMARTDRQLVRRRHPGHDHPRHAGAQSRLHRQLLGRVPVPAPTGHRRGGRRSAAARVQAGRGGPGRLRRRPAHHRRANRGNLQDLVLRDDAGVVTSPIRRIRARSDGGHLAWLPPPCLRVVRRRCRARDDRQRQVRDHARLRL